MAHSPAGKIFLQVFWIFPPFPIFIFKTEYMVEYKGTYEDRTAYIFDENANELGEKIGC